MPRFLMRESIANEDPSFDVIKRVEEEFQTSRMAATRRLVEVTKHRVMLVSSTEGRVNWILKSGSAQYYALNDKSVPKASVTWKVVNDHTETTRLEPRQPHVWLKDNPVRNPKELFEDVWFSDRMNTALTILWFV